MRVLHSWCCPRAGKGGPARVMAAAFDATVWLGESYTDVEGTVISLPGNVKTGLKKAFDDGVLEEEQDVVDDEVDLSEKKVKTLI